jgi:acyl dehydratase
MGLSREEAVGLPTGAATVHVERGPVARFAAAVTDANPVYRDPAAARAAGFDAIPAPPTFTFSAASFWGAFPEDQPEDPTGGRGNPMRRLIGELMKEGGMVLHGEQEFIYHQPVYVGATLHQEGRVVDFYSRKVKGRTLTFLVTETVFRDDAGEPVVTERFNLIHRK